VTALDHLDLHVPRGSIFGFLGPNGAGKSTAMRLLLGLARPTGGHGTVFGLDVVTESRTIRGRIGYLAQDPRYDEHRTAREVLRFAAGFFPRTRTDLEERVERSLDLVGLQDKADRPIRGYSGGERQRLGIAQAQIHDPELLILDEPAAALDPIGRRDVLRVMERLRQRTTILYSTHILEDVERVSDTVAILSRGRLVTQAPTADLLAGAGGGYTVTVRNAADGRIERARRELERRPWVKRIATTRAPGTTTWRIDATDEAAADADLLPTVLRAGLTVEAFGRERATLEDIFVDLVDAQGSEGAGHDD
jgi:ABC-2 type transport system ATP-binding protein